jgi:serine/threonine protein phosphatase PrpC
MDGHGMHGFSLVSLAQKLITKYFDEFYPRFIESPEEELVKLMTHVDKKVKKAIDCYLTGSTCIFVFMSRTAIYTASVGDSRAVLASLLEEPDFRGKSLITAKAVTVD